MTARTDREAAASDVVDVAVPPQRLSYADAASPTSADRISGLTICHVKAGRDSEFEEFCLRVIGPAVSRQRHLTGQWQLLRPSAVFGTAVGDAWVVTFALVFYGDATDEDWDLATLLEAEYGGASSHYLDQWNGFLATEQQDLSFGSTLTPQ